MNFNEALQKSIDYLSSESAIESMTVDPYWPKWNSPWWHMRLMQELGFAAKIPKVAIEKIIEMLQCHYLPTFPFEDSQLPEGVDPYRHIICHCAVGSIYQVLYFAGVDIDQRLPWMRSWILKYQLPDGGLNCDEQAYLKEPPKSSIVSTINCLEAILFCSNNNFSPQEVVFLQRGVDYLLRHGLFRRTSDSQIINSEWLEIKFPRYYEYDYFRGYYFLTRWSKYSGTPIPQKLKCEVEKLLSTQLTSEGIILKRFHQVDSRSYNLGNDGEWGWGASSVFDLHRVVSQSGLVCEALTKQWAEIQQIESEVMLMQSRQ